MYLKKVVALAFVCIGFTDFYTRKTRVGQAHFAFLLPVEKFSNTPNSKGILCVKQLDSFPFSNSRWSQIITALSSAISFHDLVQPAVCFSTSQIVSRRLSVLPI